MSLCTKNSNKINKIKTLPLQLFRLWTPNELAQLQSKKNELVFVAVPAFGYKFRSFVQGRAWVGLQNGQLFCLAQLAVQYASAARFVCAKDGPFNDHMGPSSLKC